MAKNRLDKQVEITEISKISEIEELKTNEVHFKAISQLAQALGELSELPDIYRIIYKHIKSTVRSDAFIVSLYDANRKIITAEYVIYEGVEIDPSRFPEITLSSKGYGTQSQCIRTGLPQYSPDYQKAMKKAKTQYSYTDSGKMVKDQPVNSSDTAITNSAMYVPMKTEGKVIGVIQVQSHRLDEYSSQDIRLLSGLANIAAISIRNANASKLVIEEKNTAIEAVAKEKKITTKKGKKITIKLLTFPLRIHYRSY